MKKKFAPVNSVILFQSIILILLTGMRIYPYPDSLLISIPYNSTEIKADGSLEEWEDFYTYQFKDTLTSFGETPLHKFESVFPGLFKKSDFRLPRSKNEVTFKAFWNSLYLNFAFYIHDSHLFSEVNIFGSKPHLHMNDGIEIYLDSKSDSKNRMDINDYQFLVDIENHSAVYRGDRRLILVDSLSVPKDFDQNVFFKHSVIYSGSINHDGDEDNFYIIEMSIPFAAIGLEPHKNMKMKLDVCVNDVDYHTDESCIHEYMSVCAFPFNWSGYSDFGYPQFWKNVQLTGGPGFFEALNKNLGHLWLTIYLITLALSIIIVFVLWKRSKKLRQMPSSTEIKHAEVVFLPSEINNSKALSVNQKLLKRAADLIISKKSENLHSEVIAKEIAISLRTFQRITREELNCTPTNFINIVKLNLAADFLTKHEGNVTDASYEFGFSDPSYFSKLFKKHFGHSPSEHLGKTAESGKNK